MKPAMLGRRAYFGGLALGLVVTASAPAYSEPLSPQLSMKYQIDHENPEASVPPAKERNANPLEMGYLLQDLLERAEQARKQNDYRAVVRYARAVVKAVPERAKSWSKL
jgi:hypothetical protein